MATEVKRATEAGLDGFTTDLRSIDRDSAHWRGRCPNWSPRRRSGSGTAG